MAQLKDTIVSGNLRVTDTTLTDTLQVTTIKAPTSSGTYGPGISGQVLKSNGTTVYWGSDSNSVTGVKGNAESSYRTGNVNLTPANIGALASTTKYAASSSVGGPALSVSTAGGDVVLGTSGSSSNDSGDIYWTYGNGQEKARLYLSNTYTAKEGPLYRIFKSDGTGLYSGRLPLADGTSASGTWGISITGNAATASKLGSSTVGSTRRPIYLNSGTATEANYMVSHFGNAGTSNMNDVGRMFASVGMAHLSDPGNTVDNPMNGTTKSTDWHLYWDACFSDDPSGSNGWVAQIANKAGTAQWWVRSRKGGEITNGTEWDAGWEHLTITSQAGAGSATNPVYVDSNGHTQACTYSLNKTVPSDAEFTDHITTVTSSGSGNAVTAISADANGALTVTKGSTFSLSTHTHNSLYGVSSTSAVPVTTLADGQLKVFYNVSKDLTGNMPVSNNANAIIQINKHSGNYDSQLGFSSNGSIYYRSCNGTALSASVPWKRIYDTSNPPTASEVGALASTTNYAGSSSVGGAATSANKLNTDAGAGDRPVYFSGGVPVKCATPASSSWFKGVPLITTDGVMEIGKYIDFHNTNGSTADYDYRMEITTATMTLHATGSSNILTIKSPDYTQLCFQTTSSGKAYTASGIICYPLTTSGMTTLFSFGGNVVIGGGESAKTLYDNNYDTIKTAENETLYLASDSEAIHLITSAQTYAGRKVLKILGGQLTKSGGSWIYARDNAPVHSYKGGDGTSSSFFPAIFSKSKTGGWAIGTIGNDDNFYVSYTTDAHYSSDTNTSTYTIQFPKDSGTLALTSHTHGLLHSDLNQASTNGTTGGWSVIGIDPTVAGYVLKSIRINQTSPNWLSGDFGAGIAFGGSDTKGVISMRYQYPVITFAGGNHNSSKTEPTWYLKISGTSGSTYNLANFYDSTISRTANTVLAAPNGSDGTASFRKLVAADIPDLSYVPKTSEGVSSSWWNDRDNAVIRLTKADSSYRPLWSLLTSTTGSWAVGNHNNDDLIFDFISKATYDTKANPASNAYKQVKFTNTGGITTTGAITASGTGTFKTGDFGTQLIVERTGGANMAGIAFKNTSGVLGYIAANTVDGDLYHYGATDTSTMKYTILDSHNYTSYPLPRNIKHIHTASGTEGTNGWVKIARITVTKAYADHPMTFTIAQRQTMQYRIHLVFGNTGSVATTTISEFIIARDNSWTDTNNNPRAYIIKPSDGIFDLYIKKAEGYDHIFVVDFTKADNNEGNNYSVTWTNVHAADSAITGGTEAVKKLYLPTTTKYAASSSVGGAATNVTGTLTNPTSETSYAVPFHTNPTTGSKSLLNNDGISYVCKEGTASALGWAILLLGNNVNSGTAGNKYGIVRMYPQTGNYYGQIRPVTKLTGTRTYQLPDANGNVILGTKGSTSFWGLMDGDGSISEWIRTTSSGLIPSQAAKFFQTATSSLGTNTWYFKNSYIQYMNANSLVLGAAKTTDGAAKGQLKFFSGNANDSTGTVTLECVNDAERTGDYTVKLPTWNGTIPVFEKLFEGASTNVSLSFSDINEYDIFLITVSNSNGASEQVTVASLWISNVVGVHDMPLIWGGAPSSSGGACNVTSGWIQLSKSSGTTTFSVAHKSNVAQMTSSGWTITSPTYNLYIRKIFGLKTNKHK